jgi:hypothetical protein
MNEQKEFELPPEDECACLRCYKMYCAWRSRQNRDCPIEVRAKGADNERN